MRKHEAQGRSQLKREGKERWKKGNGRGKTLTLADAVYLAYVRGFSFFIGNYDELNDRCRLEARRELDGGDGDIICGGLTRLTSSSKRRRSLYTE